MKKLLIYICFLLPFYTLTSFATVSQFEVEVNPKSVKVGETVDITIKAVDRSGKVDTSYVGEILIMSSTDPKADFPGIKNNSYTFKSENAGIVKFENAVKFTTKGNHDITIQDMVNDEAIGIANVEVGDGNTIQSSGEISISSPENGMTISTKDVEVNGQTNKNSKVKIYVNNKEVGEVISNSGGVFTYELKGLTGTEQKLKGVLLDADDKEIATSGEVLFKIQASGPEFKSIELDPNTEVEGLTVINTKVKASAGLETVEIVVNDVLEKLKESSPGEYSGNFTAPKDDGEYSIDVNLKDKMGLSLNKKDAIKIKVKNIEMLAPVAEEKKEEVKVNCDDFKKELTINNIKLVKMRSRSTLSWDKVEKASSYNVYKLDADKNEVLFQNVSENKIDIEITGDKIVYEDFVVKAVFKDDVCNIEGDSTQATKVQTGPTEIFIIALAILFASIIYFYKRRKV